MFRSRLYWIKFVRSSSIKSITWKSFRLGRRAVSLKPEFKETEEIIKLDGSYYFSENRVRISHRRSWELENNILRIKDQILATKDVEGYISFNFHPEINLLLTSDKDLGVRRGNSLIAHISTNASKIEIAESFYSPSFGKKFDCQRLLLHFKTIRSLEIITNICFSA